MPRFVHLTDLHLTPPDEAGSDRTLAHLDRALAAIAALDPLPEFVVASGDLTDRGDAESYGLLAGRLEAFPVPVVFALGNHDARGPFRAAFPGHPGEADAPLDHDRLIAGVHVITLDSSVPGRVSGALDDGQFAFLEEALSRHGDAPRILVIHHPPATRPGARGAWARLDDADSARLGAALEGRGVRAVLSGHIHLNRVCLWHGIPLVTAVGNHSTVDLLHETTRAGGLHITQGAGLALCALEGEAFDVVFAPLDARPHLRTVAPETLDRLA